ncbi:low molecular weight protein tyrosine phosphatase family protein [Pseudomonas hormoni]|uniref:Low molecular weight protein tyrosine phosphatase family protein n=1 Tax=Pseudomonas hormoni TaxID=3093767 RepID=A0ABX8F4Q6_9PSED|nr:low molecular weight protein tyrosine phosphatase family protein [Pseudomonas hormoni]QVW26710.1 low molecular weight protein tyrosine phosphatase family protein [Pseudomonas hormoni]
MLNVLFICSQNRLRSPTAEQHFADWPGVETASAGISNDAYVPVSPELLLWADLVFVMEPIHRNKLVARFGSELADKRVVCLDIPDVYQYMEPALIKVLEARVRRYLPS